MVQTLIGTIVGSFIGGAVLWAQSSSRRLLYEKAQRYTRQQQWGEALSVWRSLLWMERDSAARALIYHQLGYIALHRGDSAEALRLWEQSLRYKPFYSIAWVNYRWLRQRLQQPPPADPPPLYSQYEPPPPFSENAPPHWGQGEPPTSFPIRWLPAVRLQE